LKGVLGPVFESLIHPPAVVGKLLDGIDSSARADVARMLADLYDRGIVCDADRDPLQQHLQYVLSGDTTLTDRKVTIVGLGPMGSRIAFGLAQCGVTQLTLVDNRDTDDFWWAASPGSSIRPTGRQSAELVVAAMLATKFGVQAAVSTAGFEVESCATEIIDRDLVIVALEQSSLSVSHLVNRICLPTAFHGWRPDWTGLSA